MEIISKPNISKGTKLKINTDRIVLPRRDNVVVRCGNCGMTKFEVHVTPLKRGGAVACEIVCLMCKKDFKLRPDLQFEGTGNQEELEKD
jgi:hypothetical protein